MGRITLRALLAGTGFLLGAACMASAQATPARISLVDSVRTAAPGTAVSYMFIIERADDSGGTTEIVLPKGWRALTEAGALPPASRRISYMLAASIPSTEHAGRYPIDLVVRSGTTAVRSRAWAVVPVRRTLDLDLVAAPQAVVAGEMIQGSFRLVNTGNSVTRARVVVTSALSPRSDSVIVTLEPGASHDVPVRQQTDGKRRTLIQPLIQASVHAIEDKTVTASASFRVLVAPEEAFAAAPVHTIGSRVRVIGSSGRDAGAGIELAGSGLLRDGSSTRVDYVARRMDGTGARFGDRGEYRLAVRSPHYSVVVGNDVYRMSALSESGRYAAGAMAEMKANGWTLGGIVNRVTTLPEKREQRAAFLNRDFANGNVLSLNFLEKKERRGGSMITARTRIRAIPFATIEGEVGHRIDSRPAEAWLVSAYGGGERFSYSIFRQKTDRDYPGSTRGTESANISFNGTPARRLRVRADFSDFRFSNVETAVPGRYSRHSRFVSGVTLDGRYSLEYNRDGGDDGVFISRPKRHEELVTAKVIARLPGAAMNVSAAVGRAGGSGTGDRRGAERLLGRFAASASVRQGRNLSFSANVESLHGGTLFMPDQRSELRGGAGAAVVARSGSRFSISGFASTGNLGKEAITGYVLPRSNATLDLTWDQKLATGHTLSVRARFRRSSILDSAEEDAVRVAYTMPFGLPVARSERRGRISGRVHDAVTGRPVKGAMIQLGGQVTVTDAKGRFAFSSDSETPVILNLAGSQATAGLVPVRDLPMTISPRIGHTSNFDIAMTPSGRLEGKVRRFVNPPGFQYGSPPVPVEDSIGLPRARLELVQGEETRRALSNARGEFAFTDLRPGEWRLTVVDDDLPEFSYVEGDSVVAIVSPGQRTHADINVLPRRRKITIVQVDRGVASPVDR